VEKDFGIFCCLTEINEGGATRSITGILGTWRGHSPIQGTGLGEGAKVVVEEDWVYGRVTGQVYGTSRETKSSRRGREGGTAPQKRQKNKNMQSEKTISMQGIVVHVH